MSDPQAPSNPSAAASPPTYNLAAGAETLDAVPRTNDPPAQSPGPTGYEILGVLGRGGMGIVYRARDLKLMREVALKMMSADIAANDLSRKRFIREARAAAAVTHENIVAIHTVDDDQPIPFLVMQLVDGKTLVDVLQDGPLSIERVVQIGEQIACGLQAAHAKGLVHRDIKPANILIENDSGRVKITDFGLARALHEDSISLSGAVVGTPLFMAPEQARGEDVDHRADLFSLGAVLYALCAGQSPFMANNTMAVLRRVCDEPTPPLAQVNPSVPAWLDALVMRLLAKDPAQRVQTAGEVAALLSSRQQVPVIVGGHSPTRPLAPAKGPSSRRVGIFAAGVLVCLGVATTIWWTNNPKKATTENGQQPQAVKKEPLVIELPPDPKDVVPPPVKLDLPGFDNMFKQLGAPIAPGDLLKMHPLLKAKDGMRIPIVPETFTPPRKND